MFAFCLRRRRRRRDERGQDPRASFGRSVTGWPAPAKGNRDAVLRDGAAGQLEIGSGQSGKTRTRHGPERCVHRTPVSVVVAHYAGITVAQMNDLRSKMRAAGGTVKVAKNRLAKIALQGTDSEAHQRSVQGTDADCLFGGSGRGAEGRVRFRQGE